jgi:ferrous iron transport protein B
MSEVRNLSQLARGDSAIITRVGGRGALRQHFLDMGIIPGATVTLEKYAPMGDPLELTIHGYQLSLRHNDARQIEIAPIRETAITNKDVSPTVHDAGGAQTHTPHPGLGEKNHGHEEDERTSDHSHAIPQGTLLTFALAGNQNSGKTTLFNQLTGSRRHVGNFPGVTVDRKDGAIRGYSDTLVTDLPGIYSLSPYTSEEIVSRQFILDEDPKGIIDIVDATNLERNMYLTMQLMELNRPMVLALNMMDEFQGNGGSIDVNKMEDLLGIPVVPISASRGEGIDELISHAIHVARFQERPGKQDFCDAVGQPALHRAIHAIMHLIEDHAVSAQLPVRFAATKLIEGDERVVARLKLDDNELEAVEHIVQQMEIESGLDRAAAVADSRYAFITRVVSQCVVKPTQSKERERSEKIDELLTGKWTALPLFVAIMAAVFYLTFNVVGSFLADLVAQGVDVLTSAVDEALLAAGVSPLVHSLVIDGIFNAIGTILPICPIVVTMFFFLSLLEDTGYMARIAFVMDKLLRKIGLSGRSIVPMLMGFGCTVPAVMSARTLPSERDRKLTILLTPFMSCSTKLTIYAYFTAAFFPQNGWLVMVCLYILGIGLGILVGFITHKTVAKGEAVPFVMELPNYRLPSAKSVLLLIWDKTKDFLTRAFSVVFFAAVVIWVLQTFTLGFEMTSAPSQSILATISRVISPIFAPLGFADWRITVSLIAGFMAKEVVVSTLSVLFGTTAELVATISPLSVVSLLVFCLLYTPCVAAIAAIQRELGSKWAASIVVFQCIVAWLAAFIVHFVGTFLGFA